MKSELTSRMVPLAIIGIGCIFPGAEDHRKFWSNIRNGVDSITSIPETHWKIEDYFDADQKASDKTYGSRGGFITPVDFDPLEFAIAPNTLEAIDTSQLLGLMVAKKALSDAGYGSGKEFDRKNTSVILGVTGTLELVIPLGARLGHPRWRRALKEVGVKEEQMEQVIRKISESYVEWQESSFPGLLGNVVAGRIANYFDLGGTNCVVDAACASSLSALNLACLELASGKSDMVLTGGVDTFNDIFMYICFSKTPALSPTGDIRPFAHNCDGTVLGEGLGMVVLKRLQDAERDGDRIYAVIRNIGTSSDGKGAAVFAPQSAGQVRSMQKAYQSAGISPLTIELMEAHGTGTRVGDLAEIASLNTVYQSAGGNRAWCALGSVKSQIGHTKAAAGVAGLIKSALSLYYKVLPPTIKVEKPMDELNGDLTPFYVNTEKRPWIRRSDLPRRAALSSFGFGGSNYHCIIEEPPQGQKEIDWDDSVQIVAFSENTEEELKAAIKSCPKDLKGADLCAFAERSRKAFKSDDQCRLIAVIEQGHHDTERVLNGALTMLEKNAGKDNWTTPEGVFYASGKRPGLLGVLFPGQGSQYVGMLRDLTCQFPQMLDMLTEAHLSFEKYKSEALKEALTEYIYPYPSFSEGDREEKELALRDTRVAQPALGALNMGAFRMLQYFGLKADACAGHSYGELAALAAAGRIDSQDLHLLSALRGNLMTGARGDLGLMVAVLADADIVERSIEKHALDVVIANKNAPSQFVLSGASEEIRRASLILTESGIKNTLLPVSAAFHSPIVADAQIPFAEALEQVEFRKSEIPVFSNTTGIIYPEDQAEARRLLAGQLARPVEFVKEIREMYQSGIRTFIEVGPGSRMTGLVRAVLGETGDYRVMALDSSGGKRSGIYDLAKMLAFLAVSGYAIDLSLWNPPTLLDKAEWEKPKPRMVIKLCGANYVKPSGKRATVASPVEQEHAAQTQDSRDDRSPVKARADSTGERHEDHTGVVTSMMKASSPGQPVMSIPAQPAGGAPVIRDGSLLLDALRVTQENMRALESIQEQTARMHMHFLQNQDTALRTFQELAEQQQRLFLQSLGFSSGSAGRVEPPAVHQSVPEEKKIPHVGAHYAAAPATELPTAHPKPAATASPCELSAHQDKTPASSVPEPVKTCEETSQQGMAVSETLIAIVSEKTGYPAEMLDLSMSLDADLGIDSIKRVEIFSALRDALPELPSFRTELMNSLKTLEDIVTYIDGESGTLQSSKQAASNKAETEMEKGLPPEKERSGVQEASAERAEDLDRMVLCRQPLLKGREAVTISEGLEILITDDQSSLSGRISDILRKKNYRPRIVSIEEGSKLTLPSALGGLIIVAPGKNADDHFLRKSFKMLQNAAPALRRSGRDGGSFFVTISRLDGIFGIEGLDREIEPRSGGLAGLSKTARHEWPEVHCKAIDLAQDCKSIDRAAADIAEEILLHGPAEVGISDRGKSGIGITCAPLSAGKGVCPVAEGDVVLVTGGARGVTAECTIAFMESFPDDRKPVLVILGRSSTPEPEPEWLAGLTDEASVKKEIMRHGIGTVTPQYVKEQYGRITAHREMRRTMSRLASLGVKVYYRSVDIRVKSELELVISEIRASTESPIRALIHGAGVIADRLIEEKTDREFDAVYSTKVTGLMNLLGLLSEDELRLMVLFSSTTGRYGRKGQVDYAVANEVMNKIAEREAGIRPECRVLAMNWGPWDGGMVTPPLRKIFQEEGIGLIPLKAGAELLVREICAPAKQSVEISVLGGFADPAESDTVKGRESASPMDVAFERKISVDDYSFLKSHVLDGNAVLPVSVMIEWLAHGAIQTNPGLSFSGFNEMKVLKGLKFGRRETPRFQVLAGKALRAEGEFYVPVELRSAIQGPEYNLNASAEMVLGTITSGGGRTIEEKRGKPYPHSLTRVYSEILFHGNTFQGIERIDGWSDNSITGVVKPAPRPQLWLAEPLRNSWLADPLVIDCTFQMMILWSYQKYGSLSLPVYIGRYRQFRKFSRGPVRVLIEVTSHSPEKARARIEYVDGSDVLFARMEDYECIIEPSLGKAFRRNHLDEPAMMKP